MAITALTLLVLRTPDSARSREFYSAIGLKFVEEKHGKGPIHYTAQVGETVIEIYPPRRGAKGFEKPDLRIGFGVPDLSKLIDNLARLGFLPRTGDLESGAVIYTDPDGRDVELTLQIATDAEAG